VIRTLSFTFAALALALPSFAAEVPDLRTRKTGSDWPCFLGPTGDSKSTEKGILTDWPVKGPRIVWQRKVEEGYGMPSTSKGRLFMFDRVQIVEDLPGAGEKPIKPVKPDKPLKPEKPLKPGNEEGPASKRGKTDYNRLVCMKSETGEELWEFKYETKFEDLLGYSGGPRCCPVIDDDRVYIVGGEGVLHCLNVVDGRVLWKKDTSKDFGVVQNFFGVGATPVIEGNLLIMQVGGSPPGGPINVYAAEGKVKPNGSGVVAFDKLTGEVVYKVADELASYASPVLATIGDRRWCFVLARGGLLGFEPKTGKIDFHFPWRDASLESVNASNPVVVDDMVFISETYGPGSALLKVKPGGSTVVWSDADQRERLKAMQTHWNTSIHIDGHLYGSSGRHSGNGELRCIELKTGKVKWSEKTVFCKAVNADLRLTRCSLLAIDNHLVCLGEYGVVTLIKVNPEKFEPIATTLLAEAKEGEPRPLLEYPAWAAPIVSHGLMYLRGKEQLVCVELIPQK